MREEWSIRQRLPLLSTAVLVIVGTALVAASYVAVRQETVSAVHERLERIAVQIAGGVDSAGVGQQLGRLTLLASSQPIVDFLGGAPDREAAARAALERARAGGVDSLLVGLWSNEGELLLEAVPGSHGPFAQTPPLVGDTAGISPLRALDDSTGFYDIVAPVRARGRALGALVLRRRVVNSFSEGMRTVLGPSGGLLLGNADGSLWLDGPRVATGPSEDVLSGAEGLVSFERGGVEYLGVASSMSPIPWVALVEIGRREALAPASAFLFRILLIAGTLLVLGSLAAWVLGRRLTAPLESLEEGVSDIADGHYSTRVPVQAPAEVAHLGAAVNSMAEQIQGRTRELVASESRLRSLVSATAQIVWYANPEGAVSGPLPSWQAYTGQTDEEVANAGWIEAVHEDDRGRFVEMWRHGRTYGLTAFDCRILGDDGAFRHFAVRGVPVRENGGPIREWVGTCTDVDQQRAAERELFRAEEDLRVERGKLEAAFDTTTIGFVLCDAHGDDIYMNPAALRFHGFDSPDDMIRRLEDYPAEWELRYPDGRIMPFEEWPLSRAIRGEFVRDYQADLRGLITGREWSCSYSAAPVRNNSGDVVRLVMTLLDITEVKRAERRIRGQLEHLGLLDQITRAIGERQDLRSIFQVVVGSLEQNLPVDLACVCLHDPAAEALAVSCVGVRGEELSGGLIRLEDLIPIDDNGLGRSMKGDLVYEPDLAAVPFPFPGRLASFGLGSVVMAPLKAESRVTGVLIAARRETQAFDSAECEFLRQLSEHVALAAHQTQLYDALRQAYDDLRETQQTMMQEERLRALGQMASGIAHDINNALSPVSLYTESMLETESAMSDRGREYLKAISLAVGDVAQTVARMREFYRPREEQLTLKPVQMNTVVPQVVELTRARWRDMPQERGQVITATTELAPNLPEIMGVASEIREALTNLVLNAVDAMPGGGTLGVRTLVRESGSNGSAVLVEVSDTGGGMNEETRQRCLEPFFTTKGERGTGLGLAMVFGMVQRHSGELEIDSAVGQGTTVRLAFAVPTSAVTTDAEQRTRPAVPSRLRLLLIDDDPILLKSLCDTLQTDGHVIVVAHSGEEGIATFRETLERGEQFAAVITDLGMPRVDGRRVATAVKEASPHTPVILLTGWGRRLVEENEIPPHVDRVLAKPPKLREVREALAQTCTAPVA